MIVMNINIIITTIHVSSFLVKYPLSILNFRVRVRLRFKIMVRFRIRVRFKITLELLVKLQLMLFLG